MSLSQVRFSTTRALVFVCGAALIQILVCWKISHRISFQFSGESTSSRHSIQYLVSKLKTRESLLDKKPDRKVSVLTELKLDGTGARLETSSRKTSYKD
jgi:hypothetical protein